MIIVDILGFLLILYLVGVAVFAVGIHLYIGIAAFFAEPMPIKQGRYIQVKERDYDYDED